MSDYDRIGKLFREVDMYAFRDVVEGGRVSDEDLLFALIDYLRLHFYTAEVRLIEALIDYDEEGRRSFWKNEFESWSPE